MQVLKQCEQPPLLAHVEADAVVFDQNDVLVGIFLGADADLNFGAYGAEFQGVVEQMKERQLKGAAVACDGGQRALGPGDRAAFELGRRFFLTSAITFCRLTGMNRDRCRPSRKYSVRAVASTCTRSAAPTI
ncbi:hypothetical protein GCM10022631_35770 [Deinococcus rubellus]